KYTLLVSYVGYQSKQIYFSVKNDELIEIKIELSPKTVELREVEKTGQRIIEKNATDIGLHRMTIKDIENIPKGVESDLFRSLQFIPGVHIGFQVIVGQGMGFVSGFVPFAIAWGSAFSERGSKSTTDIALLLTIPAYIFGTATGVHWVAHLENKNHSYWKNVGFAAIGGGVCVIIGLALASSNQKLPGAGVWAMLLSPLAGSLVYTLFLADWPQKPVAVNNFETRNLKVDSYLAKDIFERSQTVNLELFRIKL
ncbi:MAG TPA: hypothetical protein VJ954_01275, partial [Ignavibacteriaceae bacterium]|nr:hypothetical protein [Ignavibacteriaceae bacterium]